MGAAGRLPRQRGLTPAVAFGARLPLHKKPIGAHVRSPPGEDLHPGPGLETHVRSILILLCTLLLLPACTPRTTATIDVGTVRLTLPRGAVVVPHPHGHGHFSGIRIRLEERVIVEIAALPPSPLPLREYVDSLVRSRNAHARPAWRLAPPTAVQIAGRSGWLLRPTCGDCQAVEVFLDLPGTRLVADWGVDGIPPLTVAERHALAWAFLDTLEPVPPP